MDNRRWTLAGATALVMAVTPACKDVPLLPKWNADETMPLASQKVGVSPPFPAGVGVPGGTSQNVSFPSQSQTIDGLIGQVLRQGLVSASIAMVVTKPFVVSGNDTLFIASSVANLTNPADPTRIVIPIAISAAAGSKDSTLTAISANSIGMLQTIANASGNVYVQFRGQATCPNPGPCTFQLGDSVTVKLQLLATIPISR